MNTIIEFEPITATPSPELQETINNALLSEYFTFYDNGVGIKGVPPLDYCEVAFLQLISQWDKLRWQLGDIAAVTAQVHGTEAYERMAAIYLGEREARTIEDWAYVARNVPRSNRLDLSFSHHRKVAKLDPNEQREWLERAKRNEWSGRRLEEVIARATGQEPPPLYQDTLYDLEMQNAELHRQLDEQKGKFARVLNILSTLTQQISNPAHRKLVQEVIELLS